MIYIIKSVKAVPPTGHEGNKAVLTPYEISVARAMYDFFANEEDSLEHRQSQALGALKILTRIGIPANEDPKKVVDLLRFVAVAFLSDEDCESMMEILERGLKKHT